MLSTLLKITGSALSLWESKEKRRYLDEFLQLEKDYYVEINKDIVDDACVDVISFKLRLICEALSTEIGKAHSKS